MTSFYSAIVDLTLFPRHANRWLLRSSSKNCRSLVNDIAWSATPLIVQPTLPMRSLWCQHTRHMEPGFGIRGRWRWERKTLTHATGPLRTRSNSRRGLYGLLFGNISVRMRNRSLKRILSRSVRRRCVDYVVIDVDAHTWSWYLWENSVSWCNVCFWPVHHFRHLLRSKGTGIRWLFTFRFFNVKFLLWATDYVYCRVYWIFKIILSSVTRGKGVFWKGRAFRVIDALLISEIGRHGTLSVIHRNWNFIDKPM